MNFAVRIKSIGGMQVKSHNSVKQGLSDYFSTLSVAASSALNRLNLPSDQEALHDFRIHLRSQRVLLNLFPHSRFLRKQREQLHAAAALTNSQRDLEVAVGLAKSLMAETQVGQKQLLFLGEELEATRTKIAVDLQTMQLPHVFMSASLYWEKRSVNSGNMFCKAEPGDVPVDWKNVFLRQLKIYNRPLQYMNGIIYGYA